MIKDLDQDLLLAFNQNHTAYWDFFWLFFTDKLTGAIFTAILILFCWKKSNFKTAFWSVSTNPDTILIPSDIN